MSTLALNIRMYGKLAVIIGGGAVALRKLRSLLAAGASIRLVATTVCPEIAALQDSGEIEVRVGNYRVADLDDAFLVIAATDNSLVNEQVSADARGRRILAAVADNPAAGDCTFPAILQRGDLEIAVSTGGRCPTFAVDVRDGIAEHIGPEYGTILDRLAEEREKLLTNGSPSTYNTKVLHSLSRRLLAGLTERKESLP
ncbi:MAG TPA: bifunctional precorrin-2 dehydrogenase/sirohydrochlorin ferrochelatase [Dongiaceae bacterium]|nr:bifunctional precorrin-2 dehydrogenase/sirohydrochlorin ferrochelatase [Dongiaceae bacterium]